MRSMVSALLAVLLLLTTFGMASASSHGGHKAGQLKNWDCINTGPHNWTHCVPPPLTFAGIIGETQTPVSVPVKVFGEDGHPFLGTEILIRGDVYNGQPCMTDGGGPYEELPFGYYACHHFNSD